MANPLPAPESGATPQQITTPGAPGEGRPLASGGRQVTRGADDFNQPQSALSGMHKARDSVRPGAASISGGNVDEEASPEEQAEYERALEALSQVLYQDERTGNAIARQLTPEARIDGIVKASLLAVTQLDEKHDFDETVIPQLTQDTVDRVIDLYENLHEEELTEQDATAALGATWEGVMEAFGVDEDTYAELTQGMDDDEFNGYAQQYQQFLGN